MNDVYAGNTPPGALRRNAVCKALKRAGNIAIGIAAGGIPWTIYDFNGYGPSVMFGGLVLYLILMDLRARYALPKEDEHL
jgi:hypothetical protein